MTETYAKAKDKLAWDKRFDALGLDRARVVDKAREVGASGGQMDWQDSWLYRGKPRFRP